MWTLSKPQKALIESLRAGKQVVSYRNYYTCEEQKFAWSTVNSLVKDGFIERPELNLVLTKLGREAEIR